jgi:hypothetical protein
MTFGSDLDLQSSSPGEAVRFTQSSLRKTAILLARTTSAAAFDVQENAAPFNLVRFLNFTLEQKASLRHQGDLHLIAGRIAVTPYFLQSLLTCLFMNHSFCGVMYGFTRQSTHTVAPAQYDTHTLSRVSVYCSRAKEWLMRAMRGRPKYLL